MPLNPFRSLLATVALASLCAPSPQLLHAQVLDLYRRVTDPRAIARFDGPDAGPLKGKFFHSFPNWDIDSTDNSGIVARDTGAGIITHLWATTGESDTLVYLKLYVNDTLVLAGTYRDFFGRPHGAFRPPLDSLGTGAVTWDGQIAYHHGFRLTVKAPGSNLYFGVEWRPVSDVQSLPWFTIRQTMPDQLRAENRLNSEAAPWHDTDAIVLDRLDTILPYGRATIAEIDGPGMLQTLRFRPSTYDMAALDSTWLNIYWDESPTPAVHVPLLDFFMCPNGVVKVRGLQLNADADSGFISYFPMPFARRARIELVRASAQPLPLRSTVQYHREPIERNLYGYFHAQFSESNPTRYHVFHPVVRALGRGRYIGYSFGVMDHPAGSAVYLEGDPIFNIDSNDAYHLRYTGGEDYFDAGWWFAGGMFTLPFAGFTHFIDAFYRFHYLDSYDFTKSFECDLQPGGNADIYDHFRTVGYYYLHWTPFWASRDTIRQGETWTISGAGYKPGESITIELGSNTFYTSASITGEFSILTEVQSYWKPGAFSLVVNGEASPNKIYVLSAPALRIETDTLPVTVVYRDSLTLMGAGFLPGERVRFYLDSISLDQSIVVDSSYGFRTMIRIPYLAEGRYLLVARGDISGNATAIDRVNLTRTLILQCEDMMPPLGKSVGPCFNQNVSFLWMGKWGKQEVVNFRPDTITVGAWFELGFTIPHADTFKVEFHNSIGKYLGKYNVILDDRVVATVDGFHINSPDWWDPLPSGPIALGTHYLSEGQHRLKFVCLGKADSSLSYWVQPDFIMLTPTTTYPRATGTLDTPRQPVAQTSPTSVSVYPNPTEAGHPIRVTISVAAYPKDSDPTRATVTVIDAVGRVRGTLKNVTFSKSSALTLPPLTPGQYFLSVQLASESGTTELPMVALSVK